MIDPVFTKEEREQLSRHKYICSYEDITKEQLTGLLYALGEWSYRHPDFLQESPPIPEAMRSNQGFVRSKVAEHALHSFSRTRFTAEEFRLRLLTALGMTD